MCIKISKAYLCLVLKLSEIIPFWSIDHVTVGGHNATNADLNLDL